MQKPIVTMEMENGDIIKMELYPNKAPETVNNFISLRWKICSIWSSNRRNGCCRQNRKI